MKTTCGICHKEAMSFIACPIHGMICMEHCPHCEYWTGRSTWNCNYGNKKRLAEEARRKQERKRAAPIASTSSMQWAKARVMKFRRDLDDVKRRVAEKEMDVTK